jgi:photosystem II stability/assembly factor-like uncharacterized protein
MQLLSSDTGWALREGRLYWTTDNGAKWKEITPQTALQGGITAAFFLNTSAGWALITRGNKSTGEVSGWDLASTTDSGATWSAIPIEVPNLNANELTITQALAVNFSDVSDGWIAFAVGSAGMRGGFVLETNDGGRTWHDVRGFTGGSGVVRFINRKDGWVSGWDERLYSTHDGGNHWTRVSLEAPSKIYPADPTYGLPTFLDSRSGFLPVNYSEAGKSAMVLFATKDGGRNWKPIRVLSNLPETSVGHMFGNSIVDSTWIVAAGASSENGLPLIKLGPKGTIEVARGRYVGAAAALGTHFGGVSASLSFASAGEGWACCGPQTTLLSTTDGGANWLDITPSCTRILNLRKGEYCAVVTPPR